MWLKRARQIVNGCEQKKIVTFSNCHYFFLFHQKKGTDFLFNELHNHMKWVHNLYQSNQKSMMGYKQEYKKS
jgi:hypothetical protein